MDINHFQRIAIGTAVYPFKGRNVIYPAMGLSDEAGEVLGKVKKLHRDQGYLPDLFIDNFMSETEKTALAKEIGDVLWYCAALAYELDIDLNYIAEMNLKKLQSRQERGTLGGSGDDR